MSNLVLTNAYLPYFTGEVDSKQEFDQEIENIQAILNSNKSANHLLLGDLNTDIIEINHNTMRLLEIIKTNELTMGHVEN
ncbi:hypothetical protein BpHYR1_019895 [Brachionus plicatilis]|uniref:Endonuclease/exonuclease/phosphatase domain-containing protein n=1 Tax=Brachionus plicatilis TaxID=10195 RepID=A0A3M7T8X4_BRAPC|nr:hypothetical protein BpHYR1_019895 [Brachionus plicatilis]